MGFVFSMKRTLRRSPAAYRLAGLYRPSRMLLVGRTDLPAVLK